MTNNREYLPILTEDFLLFFFLELLIVVPCDSIFISKFILIAYAAYSLPSTLLSFSSCTFHIDSM